MTSVDTGNRPLNFALNKVLLPWRNLLAFTENIPIAAMLGLDDALRHSPFEKEYEAAQAILPLEGAWGLSMEIGPAVEYAMNLLPTSQQLRSLATAPLWGFMGAGGVGGGIPQNTPLALGPDAHEAVQTLGPELAESLPSTAEQAATAFQNIVRQAEAFLRANPDLAMELGGSSRGAPISPNQLGAAVGQYAQGNPGFARALGGNALEAIANAIIEDAPPSAQYFEQVSGPNRIDFIGKMGGPFEGFTFELTTEAGVAGHSLRAYMQEPGAMLFTYMPIIE